MAVITVGDIVTRMKQRADIEKSGSSGFIADIEAIKLVQMATAQLQNLIIDTSENWLGKYNTFYTIPSQTVYPYAAISMSDIYKPLGIGMTDASNPQSWTALEPFDFMNMNSGGTGFLQFTNTFAGAGCGLQYMFFADTIELRTPQTVQQIGVRYVPLAPQFATVADELPSWIKPGWEEYLVACGAWMIGIKEQNGVANHEQVWQLIAKQIQNFAATLDKFRPHTVIRANMMRNRSRGNGGYGGSW